jgi:ribosomal protein S18 acetylase RimI-like enzyme
MTRQFEIRPSTAVDAPTLSLLGQATFLDAFAGILDGPDILAHCARAHAADCTRPGSRTSDTGSGWRSQRPGLAPVGYAVLAPSDLPVPDPRPDELEVKRIYLLNRFQGSGLGGRLMATAIEQARVRRLPRLLLGVYSENAAAIGFYRRLGFETIGHRSFTVGATVCDDLGMSLVL